MADEYPRDWPEHDEVTTYTLRIPSDDWNRWRDTVPRSTPLYVRLRSLINQDYTAAATDDWEDMEERTAKLLADRIKHRARTARSAIGDDDEKLRKQLDKIEEIAGTFE